MEVTVTGPNRDFILDFMEVPLQIQSMYCAEMIAQLHDDKKSNTIPGFYDQGSEHF